MRLLYPIKQFRRVLQHFQYILNLEHFEINQHPSDFCYLYLFLEFIVTIPRHQTLSSLLIDIYGFLSVSSWIFPYSLWSTVEWWGAKNPADVLWGSPLSLIYTWILLWGCSAPLHCSLHWMLFRPQQGICRWWKPFSGKFLYFYRSSSRNSLCLRNAGSTKTPWGLSRYPRSRSLRADIAFRVYRVVFY